MDSAAYSILMLNLVLGLGCGWPLAKAIARVSPTPTRVFRYFALLVVVYLVECVAFSASMATNVLSVGLAFVWGFLIGWWFRRWGAGERALLRTVLLFSLYSSLPAASFLSIPVLMVLGGHSVLSVEAGFQFGIPAFVPWPVNTILGFCVAVSLVAVTLKVVVTTYLARAFIVSRAARPCDTASPAA
ncbi:MAG: hypothetical protein JSW03_04910 [Candidatus Eiseniibacteriota bacterium]|nr:MAG: hypothetical protein JSW03_04910 [Candidatus Eisenbacteria bacterium]